MNVFLATTTAPTALALVTLLGYWAGRRARPLKRTAGTGIPSPPDTDQLLARIESISNQLRQSLAASHCRVTRYQEEIRILSQHHGAGPEGVPPAHCQAVLGPTERLSHELAVAYDELRQHTHALAQLRTHRPTDR